MVRAFCLIVTTAVTIYGLVDQDAFTFILGLSGTAFWYFLD